MSLPVAAPSEGDESTVKSPCINICKMKQGLCVGCLRTLDEIARWADASDDDKRLILAAVARRRMPPDPTST